MEPPGAPQKPRGAVGPNKLACGSHREGLRAGDRGSSAPSEIIGVSSFFDEKRTDTNNVYRFSRFGGCHLCAPVVGSGACGADGKRAGPRSRRMSGKCSNWCGPGMC